MGTETKKPAEAKACAAIASAVCPFSCLGVAAVVARVCSLDLKSALVSNSLPSQKERKKYPLWFKVILAFVVGFFGYVIGFSMGWW